jgi:hypothetical protein
MYFNTLSDLVHCYKNDNPELPFVLQTAPAELAGESTSVMSRVDSEALNAPYFLGGVPYQIV